MFVSGVIRVWFVSFVFSWCSEEAERGREMKGRERGTDRDRAADREADRARGRQRESERQTK